MYSVPAVIVAWLLLEDSFISQGSHVEQFDWILWCIRMCLDMFWIMLCHMTWYHVMLLYIAAGFHHFLQCATNDVNNLCSKTQVSYNFDFLSKWVFFYLNYFNN